MLDAALWYLALQLFAFAALPLAWRAFSRMPDRGYAFSKPFGLLAVGFFVWLIGLTQTIPNSRFTVLLALALIAALSLIAARRHRQEIVVFLRTNARAALAMEAVFAAVFVGAALLRASVPDVVHTEQSMDLMFLNSVVASPYYPPNDPWLAGERVSYYYLGYLLIGAVSMLTGVASSVAYNLGLASYAAVAAAAAFGIASNLVRLSRGTTAAGALAGLGAVFLLLLAGNALGALELAWASGAGSPAFWQWITPNPDWYAEPGASSLWRPDDTWWWWRASRVVPNAIAEFPAFSFLLGDMHPHVMSIGFVLLIVGASVQLYLQPRLVQADAARRHAVLILVTLIAVGGAAAVNLWDLPLALALVAGATLLNAARNERRIQFGRSLAFTSQYLIACQSLGDHTESEAPAAWLYARQGRKWRLARKIEAEGLSPDSEFGASVAAEGDTVVIGAPRAGAGVVRLYGPAAKSWGHVTTIRPPDDHPVLGFGHSVAMSGEAIAVASLEAVHVFRVDGKDWTRRATLYPSSEDGLVTQVAIEGNTIAAGALSADGWVVDVYRRASGEWRRAATLRPPAAAESNAYGRSVALDGGRLAMSGDGAVTIFHEMAAGWTQRARLESPNPSARESFGSAIGFNGYYLAAGAPGSNGPAPNAGAAFVFAETPRGWEFQDELTAEDASVDTALGSAVAVQGDTLALGAPGGGQGGVYAFTRVLETWSRDDKITGRWRLSRAAAAALLLASGCILAAAPFLIGFDSLAQGVQPLLEERTRPAHLALAWGVLGCLAIPFFAVAMRQAFRRGAWSILRFGVVVLAAFAPVLLWLQPVYGVPLLAAAAALFAFHQMGFQQPRADEALFTFNPRLTLIGGSVFIGVGAVWHGVVSGERGPAGELLALDRLIPVIPLALIVALALYGAWTLAHRDSEAMRVAVDRDLAPQWNGAAPALFFLAVAAALVMGAELFHVVDIFGGALRRMNTLFKLSYQAWILLAVVGGFALWFVTARWNRSRAHGRIGLAAWTAALALLFGAALYYPAAGIASRSVEQPRFTLDGLAYLREQSPADYEAVQWALANTPRDAVILEAAIVPCGSGVCNDWSPDLARIASATGRPTILGWEGHERQWRSEGSVDFPKRQADVRSIYETPDPAAAAPLLREYGVDYVVVGPRERAVYGEAGAAKFAALGDPVFQAGDIVIHRVGAERNS